MYKCPECLFVPPFLHLASSIGALGLANSFCAPFFIISHLGGTFRGGF